MGRSETHIRAALLAAANDLAAARPDDPEGAWLDAARRLALEQLLAGGEFTPADAGRLYEALLASDVRPGAAGLVVQRARDQRAKGIYYTPPALVEYLLARTLLPALADAGIPRICDPACGSGAFLAAAATRLRAAGLNAEEAAACLCGCDTDAGALALCQGALVEAGADGTRLLAADGLLADLPGPFDLVVGNPPYIASGLRGAHRADAGRATQLRQRFPESAAYKLNTYPLFVQHGIEMLRPGGRLAFVLPDSLLLGKYFARIRRFILDTCCIEEMTLIRGEIWPHGRVGQTLLLILRREPDSHRRSVQAVQVRLLASLDELPDGGLRHAIVQATFAADSLSRFRLVFSAAAARFVASVEGLGGARPLGDVLRSYSGLIAHAGQRSLLRSTYADGMVRVEKGGRVLFHGTPQREAWRPVLRSGAEVDRFWLNWRGEHALLEPALLKSGGKLHLYEGPKLLLRQTADRLVCAYDASGLFCLNNVHLLTPRAEGVEPFLLYFAALLNSGVLNRYWRLLALEEGRLYPQIDLDMLDMVPVPPPEANPEVTSDLIGIAEALHALPPGAENRPGLMARADALVAELYELTSADGEL